MMPVRDRRPVRAQANLLERLGEALDAAGVVYCQWKGHLKRARWASGAGDVDLLVDHAWGERLAGVLDHLGFKPTVPPPAEQMPGTASWFGFDAQRGSVFHIHVHYRIILGYSWTTTYQIPIERAILDSSVLRRPFPVPAPELEYMLLVLRMVQRYSPRDLLALGAPDWIAGMQGEFSQLLAHVDRRRLVAALAQHLPAIDVPFFDACARSLRTGASRWHRLWLRAGLDRRLRPHARRPPLARLLERIGRRLHLLPPPRGMHFARGGRLFALLGGDGSGKSTCTAELRRWLAPHFHVSTAHLGRPPRSATTLLIGGIRKVYRAICRAFAGPASEDGTGVLDLLRHVCTARDRYHLFLKSRRFATAGGVALCERYPVPQNRLLVGPEIARLVGHGRDTPLARRLMRAEQAYYGRITPPDVILVLLVEPEIAVQRKTTEPPDYVRARARIMWETDWTGTGAHLVDANQQLGSVVADLKTLIWSEV